MMNPQIEQILGFLVLPWFSKIGYSLRQSGFSWLNLDLKGKSIVIAGGTAGLSLAMFRGLCVGIPLKTAPHGLKFPNDKKG